MRQSTHPTDDLDVAALQAALATAAVALEEALRRVHGVDVGEYREQSRISFVDYARMWIDTYDGRTSRGIRPGTLRDYRRALGLDAEREPTRGGAVAYFDRTPLAAVTPQEIKQYAAECAAKGLARNTVRLRIAPVKAMLATAHEEDVIRSNPAAGLRLGRTVAAAPVKETHALTEEEVVRVLAEIPERHRLLCAMLAQTGLRISEGLALAKADIDFGRRRLSVSRRLYEGRLDAPKSRDGVPAGSTIPRPRSAALDAACHCWGRRPRLRH